VESRRDGGKSIEDLFDNMNSHGKSESESESEREREREREKGGRKREKGGGKREHPSLVALSPRSLTAILLRIAESQFRFSLQ